MNDTQETIVHPSLSFDFGGRLAVVTGAAQGLGQAMAAALAAHGAMVHGFDSAPADEGSAPSGFTMHQADVTDAAGIDTLVRDLPGAPSLLINNAGIARDRTLIKMTDKEWADVLSVNLTGAFNMVRAVAPGMVEAGYGRIVNITSINGLRGKFGQTNYAASKAGLIGLTKSAARELGTKGVTVNAVAPGMVMTEMAAELPQEIRDRALAEAVTGKLAGPGDIATAVLFLLSEAAAMITGQVLQVDGGQYL